MPDSQTWVTIGMWLIAAVLIPLVRWAFNQSSRVALLEQQLTFEIEHRKKTDEEVSAIKLAQVQTLDELRAEFKQFGRGLNVVMIRLERIDTTLNLKEGGG